MWTSSMLINQTLGRRGHIGARKLIPPVKFSRARWDRRAPYFTKIS